MNALPDNVRYLRPGLAQFHNQVSSEYDYEAHMSRLSDNDIRKKRWLAGMSEEENRRLSNKSLTKKRS